MPYKYCSSLVSSTWNSSCLWLWDLWRRSRSGTGFWSLGVQKQSLAGFSRTRRGGWWWHGVNSFNWAVQSMMSTTEDGGDTDSKERSSRQSRRSLSDRPEWLLSPESGAGSFILRLNNAILSIRSRNKLKTFTWSSHQRHNLPGHSSIRMWLRSRSSFVHLPVPPERVGGGSRTTSRLTGRRPLTPGRTVKCT